MSQDHIHVDEFCFLLLKRELAFLETLKEGTTSFTNHLCSPGLLRQLSTIGDLRPPTCTLDNGSDPSPCVPLRRGVGGGWGRGRELLKLRSFALVPISTEDPFTCVFSSQISVLASEHMEKFPMA